MKLTCRVLHGQEIDNALQLLFQVYRKVGYVANGQSMPQAWTTTLKAETTVVFGAFLDERLVGTGSILGDTGDSLEGIPMDRAFKDMVDEFRKSGTVAEVGKLAIDTDYLETLSEAKELRSSVSIELIAKIILYGIEHYRYYCIAVMDESHVSFYQKALFFSIIGEKRLYATSDDLQGTPETPLALDLKKIKTCWRRKQNLGMFYRKIFKGVVSLEKISA